MHHRPLLAGVAALEILTVASCSSDSSSTATGDNPNETAALASIPCSGPGSSTVQLRGCTEDNECAESAVAKVTVT